MNKKKIIIFFSLFFLFLMIGILYLYYGEKFHFFIPCLFYKWTGYYCPGCGITRMFCSILKFDFYQAFRYNVFLFCVLPFVLVYGMIILLSWFQDKKIILPHRRLLYIFLYLFLLFGIVRNLPDFSYLVPVILEKWC